MANDWGRPFTPEELAKLAKPTPGDELHYTGPNLAFQVPPTDPTPATLDSTPEELAAKGWGKPDGLRLTDGSYERGDGSIAWAEPEPRTAPVETYSEADGPWYVVYFGPVLYTVLAGPYDTQEAAEERIPIVWGQFEHDAAYDFTFPVRERSGLRATTVRSVFNLKGAYGKQ